MTKAAAEEIYRMTGYRPQDVDVVELHDCFSCNELITYEALGLCQPGERGEGKERDYPSVFIIMIFAISVMIKSSKV